VGGKEGKEKRGMNTPEVALTSGERRVKRPPAAVEKARAKTK
jgi:hypothetical protein